MKLKDLPTKYDFKTVEKGKYRRWVENGYFQAGVDPSKKPYTIVIPPPNITGKLHIGHVLNTTLQDIIVRRKRMKGYDVLYLPGMDHASIATQAKVEAELRKRSESLRSGARTLPRMYAGNGKINMRPLFASNGK